MRKTMGRRPGHVSLLVVNATDIYFFTFKDFR